MRYLKPIVLAVAIGIGVALTYLIFERAVHHSTMYVWTELFNSNVVRWLVVPLSLGLGLAYFGVQHWLDPKSEGHEAHGLGGVSQTSLRNFAKILFIGYFSLIAGASLGPEAVLVPACVVLGGYFGRRVGKGASMYGALGFVALMASFFNSFSIGVLSLLLVKKQLKLPLSKQLVVLGVIASGGATVVLHLLEGGGYLHLPRASWHVNLAMVIVLTVLFAGGYTLAFALKYLHEGVDRLGRVVSRHTWWVHALVASSGLAALYLIGGPLIQFTGNESIRPVLDQASDLGLFSLLIVLVSKLSAMAWSRALGYRGGLIFPVVFASSVLVAIATLYVSELNVLYALFVTVAGCMVADRRADILL